MTQTDVMQMVREDTDKIRRLVSKMLDIINSELGGLPSDNNPQKFTVYVGYDEFDIRGLQVNVNWLNSRVEPLVFINTYTEEIKVGYNTREKEVIDLCFKPYKWLGVKFDGDKSRMVR